MLIRKAERSREFTGVGFLKLPSDYNGISCRIVRWAETQNIVAGHPSRRTIVCYVPDGVRSTPLGVAAGYSVFHVAEMQRVRILAGDRRLTPPSPRQYDKLNGRGDLQRPILEQIRFWAFSTIRTRDTLCAGARDADRARKVGAYQEAIALCVFLSTVPDSNLRRDSTSVAHLIKLPR